MGTTPEVEEAAFSETVSEKPKRGRPSKFTKEERDWMRKLWFDRGPRSLNDHHYGARAGALLMHDPRFRWLCDPEEGRLRGTILAQLGRIEDDEDLREAALALCEHRPTTRVAVAALRRWRLGQSDTPDSDRLADELLRAIRDYVDRFPDTSSSQVLEALSLCCRSVDADL